NPVLLLRRALHAVFDTLLCSHPAPAAPAIYPLSLHDALPICTLAGRDGRDVLPLQGRDDVPLPRAGRQLLLEVPPEEGAVERERSEEHTSELQSRENLVCRLLLEKKKKEKATTI